MKWTRTSAWLAVGLILLSWAAIPHAFATEDTTSSAAPTYILRQLVGRWEGTSPSGQAMFEYWVLRRGALDGQSGTLANGQETVREQARIMEINKRWVYLAFPQGQEPTMFVLHPDSSTATRWVFLNPEHDSPQRIIYQFTGKDSYQVYTLPLTGTGKPYEFKRMKGN